MAEVPAPSGASNTAPALPLYPFQQAGLDAIAAAEQAGCRRQLLAWATGLGKTIAFVALIAQRGGRALILVHRDELIRQAVEKMRMVMPGADAGVVQAERDERHAQIVVASVQTLAQRHRLADFPQDFRTVVVDEAHHAPAATYQRILSHVRAFTPLGQGTPGGPLTLGVTATPYRLDGKPLGSTFERIVQQVSILDGILGGYLCDLVASELTVDADLDAIGDRGGDLDEGSVSEALLDADAERVIAKACARYAPERNRILVFVPGVELAHMVAEEACDLGLVAEALDGTTSRDERRALLARFSTGETQVVVNCGVLTEGYDEPAINCIIQARPTKSRGQFVQMVGRGTRRSFDKKDCRIVTLVGSGQRHDLVTMPDLLTGDLVEQLGRDGAADARIALASGHSLTNAVATVRSDLEITFREQAVNLFTSGRLLWRRIGTSFVVDVGLHRVAVDRIGTTWRVLHLHPKYAAREVWRGPSSSYAQGVAEQYVVAELEPPGFMFQGKWQAEPPTDKQLALLRRNGLSTAGLTRGEASALIGRILGCSPGAPDTGAAS